MVSAGAAGRKTLWLNPGNRKPPLRELRSIDGDNIRNEVGQFMPEPFVNDTSTSAGF